MRIGKDGVLVGEDSLQHIILEVDARKGFAVLAFDGKVLFVLGLRPVERGDELEATKRGVIRTLWAAWWLGSMGEEGWGLLGCNCRLRRCRLRYARACVCTLYVCVCLSVVFAFFT